MSKRYKPACGSIAIDQYPRFLRTFNDQATLERRLAQLERSLRRGDGLFECDRVLLADLLADISAPFKKPKRLSKANKEELLCASAEKLVLATQSRLTPYIYPSSAAAAARLTSKRRFSGTAFK